MDQKRPPRVLMASPDSGKIVYRYLSLRYGLEALQTGYWKVGRISVLNDPFDCRPQIINVPPGTLGGAEFPANYLSHFTSNFGLLCFSEVINDPVLWSHYSDAHTGVALGFDFGKNLDAPLPVTYGSVPPVIDFRVLASLMQPYSERENNTMIFQQGFTKKAPSWSYEKEWRQFVKLDGCTMSGIHYFRAMPTHLLREVVVGARCSMEMIDVGRIVRKLQGVRKYTIKKCRMVEASYEFNFDVAATPQSRIGAV